MAHYNDEDEKFLASASSAPVSPIGRQPAAWRWKWGAEGKWFYGDRRPADDNPKSPYYRKLHTVESLFTSPTP